MNKCEQKTFSHILLKKNIANINQYTTKQISLEKSSCYW